MKGYICTLYIHTSFVSKLPGFCWGCQARRHLPYLFLFPLASGVFRFCIFICSYCVCTCVYDSIMRFTAHKGIQRQLLLPFLCRFINQVTKTRYISQKKIQFNLFLLIYFCHYFYYCYIFAFFSREAVLIKILHKEWKY